MKPAMAASFALAWHLAVSGLAAAQDSPDPGSGFATSQICAGCHEAEAQSWRNSHHAVSMLEADDKSVLAPFDGETFTNEGVTSTFFRRNGKFLVNTDGPDGKLADFEIAYTFGYMPLQQYLISSPGGRYQALGIAWDSRPRSEGGQRWFHLYPNRKLEAGDPLHWTGIDQNWNYQCAWCHSTDLRKSYDRDTDTFSTTWSEINVGCEACHGPGEDHVRWASKPAHEREAGENGAGFELRFDERDGTIWEMGNSGSASRSNPRFTSKEINVCAGCHARRGQFSDDPHHTFSLFDAFRPALIEQGLYYADGQQRDEVYKYGSFLQSKMHAEGVTCSDCHDPHSGKLVLEENALCGQCHAPDVFDSASHHHHEPDTPGAECVSCHMPATNYMIVDARRDHSLRIPRPDLSVSLSIPNACNMCHADRDAEWAAAAARQWYPETGKGAQDFARLFDAADRGVPGSRESLVRYLEEERPAIVAASALSRLARNPSPSALRAAANLLSSPEPLVRAAAIRIVALATPEIRLELLQPLLADPSRLARMDAARALAGDPETRMDATTRTTFEEALTEYIDAESYNADRPESNANLASLHRDRGNIEQARRYFEIALDRDPSFVPATIGLAEIQRSQGNEQAAENLLREAAAKQTDSADIALALGLSLVRKRATEDAMEWLQKAARLGQANPRFAYVYAVALHDAGETDTAVSALGTALLRHPYDRDLLNALLSYEVERGNIAAALAAAETLAALEPDNTSYRQILDRLQQRQ